MSTAGSNYQNLMTEESPTWGDVHQYVERRAIIEQAKGVLMFVYGIDANEAFDVLRTQSQRHNIKLRLIAEQVVKDMVELAQDTKGPARRRAFDGVMSTARQRIRDVAARQLDGQSKTGVQMKELNHPPELC
jgi:predicted butyrate kinase (DUF1464 family)